MENYEYIKDFHKLGLGLFVHFGLYSVVGKGEWFCYNLRGEAKQQYEQTAREFVVDENWAKKLVATAKETGAKYITLTTRHHDGFSLFDTCGLSDFDAPHSASKRDLVAEFVNACKAEGIVPFFYHTLIDWHNADYKNDFAAYIDYLVASVELLCKNYGKTGGFWFDGFWDKPDADWQFDRLYGTIRKYQPTAMIINNTGLNALGQVSHREIDSVTFERGKPCFVDCSDKPRAGEMCEGLTDHWGYAERDICVKSVKQIVETYVNCRSCGCNLLLNTGLKGDGTVVPSEKIALEGLGRWITYTGESLYNATPSEITAEGAAVLQDGEDLYVCVNDVPMESNVNVTRMGTGKRTVKLNTNRSITTAIWMDNGKQAEIVDNVLVVAPFDYGTSLGSRVAKLRVPRTRIAFLGDSITEGAGASDVSHMYTHVLCDMLDATELNYGVGGTRIAAQRTSTIPSYDEYFLQRARKIDKDTDFLFVFGGTNDYGHGDAPFGHDGDISDYTFCGAINNLLQYLTTQFDRKKICFILPLNRYNQNSRHGDGSKLDGEPLCVYRNQILQMCEKYGVDCLDICDVFPEPQTVGDEYTVDGLHPNDTGHRRIAERLKKYLADNNKL